MRVGMLIEICLYYLCVYDLRAYTDLALTGPVYMTPPIRGWSECDVTEKNIK